MERETAPREGGRSRGVVGSCLVNAATLGRSLAIERVASGAGRNAVLLPPSFDSDLSLQAIFRERNEGGRELASLRRP